jgi:hypothetical protein
MRLGFMNRIRNGYGNIYTPHAGSMIIQVQRETGLANRTIVITERQVAMLRVLGSRVGILIAVLFFGTWLVFAVQSVRVPLLSERIQELERENQRIDSLQVALSRIHGRYEQVRQMLAAVGGSMATRPDPARNDTAGGSRPASPLGMPPNAVQTAQPAPPVPTPSVPSAAAPLPPAPRDTGATIIR